MSTLLDARGNEYQGSLDAISNQTLTDPRTQTFALGSNGAEVVMDLNGKAVAVFEIRSAAVSATFEFAVSMNGSDYFVAPARPLPFSTGTAGAAISEGIIVSQVFTTAAAAAYAVNVTGWRKVRCRITAYTSGSANVSCRATEADHAIIAQPQPTLLTATGEAATGTVLTIAAPGAGLFQYITSLNIQQRVSAAITAAAAVNVTATNLGVAGATAYWAFPNAGAIGVVTPVFQETFPNPIKCFAANSTIVFALSGALAAGGNCRIAATYYLGA